MKNIYLANLYFKYISEFDDNDESNRKINLFIYINYYVI